MDSSGMGALVEGAARLRSREGEFKLSGVNEKVAARLRDANLDSALEMYASELEALRSFSPPPA